MARLGRVIENPPMGARIVFRETAEETHGDLLRFDFFTNPTRGISVTHVHPTQEERFEVVAGTMRGRLAGELQTVCEGEAVVIPPGTPHAWWNDGDGEAHLIVEYRPALRTEILYETVFWLSRHGKTNKHGLPRLIQLSVLLAEYGAEFYPTWPPRFIQKALVLVVAPIARIFGYRASYS